MWNALRLIVVKAVQMCTSGFGLSLKKVMEETKMTLALNKYLGKGLFDLLSRECLILYVNRQNNFFL